MLYSVHFKPSESNTTHLPFDKLIPVVVWERAVKKGSFICLERKANKRHLLAVFCVHIRCIQDQSVPLALDVIIFRLLSDVEAVKLQLSCKFFLSFEDHQWNLTEIR